MIEILNQRKSIHDLLSNYPSKLWKHLIPIIMEIGIVYLSDVYYLKEFKLEDFEAVLDDMKRVRKKENEESKEETNRNNNHKTRTRLASKPSGEWRTNSNSASPDKNNLNPFVYPIWWGDNSNEDRSRTKSRNDYSPIKTEVFIPEENKFRSRSKSNKPKTTKFKTAKNAKGSKKSNNIPKTNMKTYPHSKLKSKSRDVESKIKHDIIYDKYVHSQNKRNQKNNYNDWGYYPNSNETRPKRNNHTNNNKKINYVISYDKNLRPESICEKIKDRQEQEVNNIEHDNNMSIPVVRNREVPKPKNEDLPLQMSDKKFKNRQIEVEDNVPNTAKFNERETEEMPELSFKRMKQESDNESNLSSYAPSERTKSRILLTLDFYRRNLLPLYTDHLRRKIDQKTFP